MARNKIIMIYPSQGFSGTYVRHMPLSLLYANTETVKAGFEVELLDLRVTRGNWQEIVSKAIGDDTLCVGISVMSGNPITHARAISRHIKARHASVPVVWGGPHATFHPQHILRDEPAVDFVISGYGSKPFHGLCTALRDGGDYSTVAGLFWRDGATTTGCPKDEKAFEFIDYKDIPYHLIDDYSVYGQLDQNRRIFSMYSAMGCPYLCSFCSSPAQYAGIDGKRWVPLTPKDVVDHVEHVVTNYGADYIYFIDDDSFPKLGHVEAIIDGITERKLPVKLGFRGARINEIGRMSDEFLDKLAAAGTDIMHIGAESGSDRLLKMMHKNCTVDDIIAANKKLARHPTITAAYNFIMGLPTETLDDLKSTRDLMLRLVDDNPNCLVFPPNKFRPLPGTELYDIAAKEWGYAMPDTLDAWANIEVEGDISDQWYDKDMAKFCNLMLIGSYFVDNKVAKVTEGRTVFMRLLRLINATYRPIARFRMERGLSGLLIEYWAYRHLTRIFAAVQSRLSKAAPQS